MEYPSEECTDVDFWKRQLRSLSKSELLNLFLQYVDSHSELLEEVREKFRPFPILKLQPELLIYIFGFLSPKELLTISHVCKTFYKLSNENVLWAKMVCNFLGVTTEQLQRTPKIRYKKYYIERITRVRPGTKLGLCVEAVDAITLDMVHTKGENYPNKRQKHTACVVGKKIYYIGGEIPR